MNKIAFIGFGEFGKQLFLFINEMKIIKNIEIIYFDDDMFNNNSHNSFPFESYLEDKFNDFEFYVTLGYKHLKRKKLIIDNLLNAKRKIPNLIHNTSYISPNASLGVGVYIYPGCVVDKNVKIMNGTTLNNSVVVSHDSIINECCFLAPSVTLSGFVKIGAYSFLGTGTLVSNNVEIGSNVKTGIGSVVTGNLESNISVIGNPLKILKNELKI